MKSSRPLNERAAGRDYSLTTLAPPEGTMLRALIFAIFATVAFTSAVAPAGSSQTASCGLMSIQDPEIRASFARFEANQSRSANKICAIFRNAAI